MACLASNKMDTIESYAINLSGAVVRIGGGGLGVRMGLKAQETHNMRTGILKLVLAAGFLCTALPGIAQAVPSATESIPPLVVGGGFTVLNPGSTEVSNMYGFSAFADWNPSRLPTILRGLGFEADFHSVTLGKPADEPNKSFLTLTGGAIYTVRATHKLHPFIKYTEGYGKLNFTIAPTNPYKSDSRTIYAPAAGFEYQATSHFWIRAEYEYQIWPSLFSQDYIHPNGVTVSVSYHVSRPRYHHPTY